MSKKNIITILLLILFSILVVGIYLIAKPELKEDENKLQTAIDAEGNKEKTVNQSKNEIKPDDLVLKDVSVRYKEEISEVFHGEQSGGYFYYIVDTLVYEKPGEDQAFLSVTDGKEVKNYGKKADFRRKGMTVLAKTIDMKGQFCQLEQDKKGSIYLVVYAETGQNAIRLRLEDKTLETDFSRCVLMMDSKAIYVRADNPGWKNMEDAMPKTFLIFSYSGNLIYEDNGMDMEPEYDGLMVIFRRRPKAAFFIDFIEVNGDTAVRKDRKTFITGSNGRLLCGDRSTGQWYCIEGGRIETFDIDNITPAGKNMILNYGTDTSFQLVKCTEALDYYDNDMELLDGQVCDNGLINLMMGKKEEDGFAYQLYQYRRYEDTRTDYTLTVTVPYPIPLISQAAVLYEKKYPESHIKIESAYDTYADFETYLMSYGEQMTARIMTGDFGDIVCSSQGLYQELLLWSDAYLDLGEWIKTTEQYEDLNKGALKGLTVDGALRALPVGVDLYYYGINRKLAEEEGIKNPDQLTWGQLLDIALKWKEEGKKEKTLFGGGIVTEDLLGVMIMNNLNDLINIKEKTCDLHQEWFMELMEKWKEVYKSGHMYSYGQTEMYRERSTENTRFMNGFEKGSLLQAYARRALEFDWEDVDYVSETEQFNRYNETYGCPQILIGGIYGEKSRNFSSVSSMMFSVNARAEHKEEALRFMEFLMSERVQALESRPGIPLNLAADRKNWEKAAQNITEETQYVTSEKVMGYYEQFSQIYEEIDMLYPSYYSLYIERPMMSYISGTMTLEEALDKAEKDLWLHLNE